MNLTFAILMLLFSNLFEGLSGLRLIKVSIPAYKLRGESAFLECQYELNKPKDNKGTSNGIMTSSSSSSSNLSSSSSSNSNSNTGSGGGGGGVGSGSSSYRRIRTHQHQRYHRQQQQQTEEDLDGMEQQQQQRNQQSPYEQQSYRMYDDGRLREHYNSYDSIERTDEGEALYAVKWYKDNEEFYRYVPKANPPKQSYRVDGIRVIEEHSDHSKVLLRGLTLNSTGLYRCEVSAEAPNFSSVQGEGRMDIVYLPRDGPHIRGKEDQYQIGDTLNLNCTSGKSHPASHLQWFINDEPLTHSSALVHYNDTVHRHGLITSTLGLQLTVDARHFQDGVMRVKCLASISPVLWKGGKESVLQRRPGVIDNREAMLLVLSSSMYWTCSPILILLSSFCQLLLVKLQLWSYLTA